MFNPCAAMIKRIEWENIEKVVGFKVTKIIYFPF
jgi:hypothetical protein